MIKAKLNYHDYTLTFPHEVPAAVAYIERCDPLPLAELIKSELILSPGMKDFIADIVTGKYKRKNGQRATTELRDFEVYLAIRDLMDVRITKESAIAQVALNFDMPECTIEAAYKRIKKKHFNGR